MKTFPVACLPVVVISVLGFAQSNPSALLIQPLMGKNPVFSGLSQPNPAIQRKIADNYGRLPLSFEANRGQSDGKVKFLSHGSGYTLFLMSDEAVFSLWGNKVDGDAWPASHQRGVIPMTSTMLRMRLVKANRAAKVTGADELPGKSNYFIGNDSRKWRTNVPTYAKVKYEGVYSGIDLVYYGNQQQLEYDFVVAPGVDPRHIQFDVRGATKIGRDRNGDLVLHTATGEFRWRKPVVYQEKGGMRQEIDGRYVIKHGLRVGFEVAGYDSKRPLTIDPALGYATYFGGSGNDQGSGIVVDSSGDAYITGVTQSTDFPTMNSFQSASGGYEDVFVAELNPAGTALVYSTYLGGSGNDQGAGIAVDSLGDAYVTGGTSSTDFPTTLGALQTMLSGGSNAFVTEINPTGSALVYSTYLGGSGNDQGAGIAVDSSGDAYLTGTTNSSNFPTTPGAVQTTCGGGCNNTGDAFVTELNPAGTALVYSTYLGGSGNDQGAGIAVDSLGDAYITGWTSSTDFPTMNPSQPTYGGSTDAFATEINPTGSALVYSTYLGGSGNDQGAGIAVDSLGNAYVIGETFSTDFPTTPGAFQTTCGEGCSPYPDAFLAKLSPSPFVMLSPSSLNFGNQNLGTSSTPQSVTLTNSGEAPLSISSIVTSGDFSQTNTCPVGGSLPTGSNCIITVTFTPSVLGSESGSVSITDNAPNNPQSVSLTGVGIAPLVTLSPTSLSFGNQPVGITSGQQTSTLTNTGNATLMITSIQVTGINSGDFAQSNNCGTSVPAGGGCTITVTFTPSVLGSESASVGITDNAPNNPQSVPLTGAGVAALVTLSPTSLSFANQPVGITSGPQTSTLTNTGNATLMIGSIQVAGANTADFAEINNCGTSVPAGGGCTITVNFTPSVLGSESASVSITDNAPNNPQSVPLTGTGTPPIVTLSPPSLTFGQQPVGATSLPQTVTVSASGALNISSITTGTEFNQTNNCGSGISAGGSCQINVTFTPTALGVQNGTLMITDGGAGSPQSVPLSGAGTQGTAVTTHHYDNLRTGWNNTESVLTPANVGSPSFGMLQSIALDAQVDAQPLFVPNQAITTGNYQGIYDVVYVASEGNTIYAIDANSGQILLRPNFGTPVPTPIGCSVNPVVGINSTPVIDLSSTTMYVIIYTSDSNGPEYRIHALDLGSLTDKVAPVAVAASHILSDGSTFNFNATYQRQRPALLLANGNVYAGFGSFCDKGTSLSRGWLLGWQAGTLTPLQGDQIFDAQAKSSHDFFLSSIWMSGSGIAADQSGSLYLVTGNSDPSGTSYDGVTDIQESVIKVSPDLSTIVDLFTPYDWGTLDQNDKDFGSGGVMLLPPQLTVNLAVAAGKEGNMFLMNQEALGGYNITANNVLGTFAIGKCFCGASYFVDPSDSTPRIVSSGGGAVGIWKLQTNPTITLTNIANSSGIFVKRGTGFFTTVSSNGIMNPIIWAIGRESTKTAELDLYALDPEAGGSTLKQIFVSRTPGTWPYNGNANLVPVVANGQVFVASGQRLTIFGVLPGVKFSHATLTFPDQVVSTTSKAKAVTLTNSGLGVLKIASIAAAGQFSQTNNCGTTVNPSASCTINVTFSPTTIGTLTGSVSVTDNAPHNPQRVTLTGIGTYVQLSTTSMNFGNQPIGTTSPPKYVTLTNKGSVTLNFTGTGITITGTNAGDFAETNNCGSRVASGASCKIKVTFQPSAQGQRTANVSISDDGGGSPQMVPLTGTGTP